MLLTVTYNAQPSLHDPKFSHFPAPPLEASSTYSFDFYFFSFSLFVFQQSLIFLPLALAHCSTSVCDGSSTSPVVVLLNSSPLDTLILLAIALTTTSNSASLSPS